MRYETLRNLDGPTPYPHVEFNWKQVTAAGLLLGGILGLAAQCDSNEIERVPVEKEVSVPISVDGGLEEVPEEFRKP